MKNNTFSTNFTIIIISMIALLLFFIIFAIKYRDRKQNFKKIHNKKIDELKNQINWIKFDKTYIEKNQYIVSLGIQIKTIEDAQNIQRIIENSTISDNQFTVQLQNDPQNTRKNLLLLTFDSKEKYNPKFEKIIKKLVNSKYTDKVYQKLSNNGPKLSYKESTGKNLTNSESKLLSKFHNYKLQHDTTSAQLHRRIDFDNFAEFILICQKNQKSSRIDIENIDQPVEKSK